jgi:hypothetical protein
MKTILSALIILSLAHSHAAPAQDVETIHTIRGKTYLRCKILQRDADGVAFSHQNGTARILFSDLPESTRFELGYNAQAASDLEKSREKARQEKEAERRLQQERAAELRHAARLAEIKRQSQLQQPPMIIYQQGSTYTGPVPAVGFAAAAGWGGVVPPVVPRARGWENVGIATIGSGSGGIYVPQSGGFIFTGLPQVHYSPTLGYYNPGGFATPVVPSIGTFGTVPGLAAPMPPAVVPGVSISGSATMPVPR